MQQTLLGQILVKFGMLTEAQLLDALRLQTRKHPNRYLGEILIELGLIEPRALESILSVQRRRVGIHQAQGRLTNSQVEERLCDAALPAFLHVARDMGASDFYLTSGLRPAVRLNGNLVDLPVEPLSFEQTKKLLFSLLTEDEVAAYYERKSLDKSVTLEAAGRFRVSVFRHLRGIAGVFRTLADTPRTLQELGLPPVVEELTNCDQGLMLVTGPAGSGKSTTLASLVDRINRSRSVHVLTVEDPIEVLHESYKAFVTQREVTTHTDSAASALRSALRADPDVLVVGELRDPEMVSTAITAAETGHLVFATLHTSSAASTILRIVDQFPAQKRNHVRMMLASSLRGIVSQRLVPNVDGRGRSLACEVLVSTPAIARLIRDDRVWQIPTAMQMGAQQGMRLMDDALLELVRGRRVSLDEALAHATERDKFLQRP
jgi:twitching motility protein PilT